MSNKDYADRDDCEVIRNHPDYFGSALLMDCNGDIILEVSETWIDSQIFTALRFANKTYRVGHADGVRKKTQEIRKALELDEEA